MQLFKQAGAHGLGSLPGNVLCDFMISLPQSGSQAEVEGFAASVGGWRLKRASDPQPC